MVTNQEILDLLSKSYNPIGYNFLTGIFKNSNTKHVKKMLPTQDIV